MIIDTIDTSDLGANAEAAFIVFEQRLRSAMELERRNDKEMHSDRDGNYTGSYEPERAYVGSILAFFDVFKLDINVDDITELNNEDFDSQFKKFSSKINYIKSCYTLLKGRIESGGSGTPILITPDYKHEISKNLETIRKIVNQEVTDQNKRDAIFNKLNALQAEVDRDRTTIDALFGRLIDFSKVVGEFAENCEPLVSKVERLSDAFCKAADRVKLSVPKERTKLISSKVKQSVNQTAELLDDEIPF